MAWEEDQPSYTGPRGTGRVPMSQMESHSLFALLLVAVSGALLLYSSGLILFAVSILIAIGFEIINPLLITLYIIYLPIGCYQLYLTWGMYNRKSSAGKQAIYVAIIVIAMSVMELAISMLIDQMVLGAIVVNAIVLYLLTQTKAKHEFIGSDTSPEYSTGYY